MWFDKSSAPQAVPVVFPARARSAGGQNLLDAWLEERGEEQAGVASSPPPAPAPLDARPEPPGDDFVPAAAGSPAPSALDPEPPPPEPPPEMIRIQQEIIDNLACAVRDVHVLRSTLYSELEVQLVTLAAKMAQRVIHREIVSDPTILADLAREGIQALGDRQNVVIRIGPLPNPGQTQALVQQLQQEYPDTRVLIDDDRAPGACVVEAELGRVDESVEARLDNVLDDILDGQIPVAGSAS